LKGGTLLSGNPVHLEKEIGNILLLEEALRRIGLTRSAAAIYIFLLKKGKPQNAREIIRTTRTNKALVYRILKDLQANGYIVSTMTYPSSFTAIPLDEVLDQTAKSKKREAQLIVKDKKLLHDAIKSFEVADTSEADDIFTILRNRQIAIMKGKELMKQTTNECLVMNNQVTSNVYDIAEGLQTSVASAIKRKKIQLRLLTYVDYAFLDGIMKIVGKLGTDNKHVKIRHLDLSPAVFPGFALFDESAIIFQFDTWKEKDPKKGLEIDKLLWTNNKPIIQMAKLLFNRLWDESIDIQDRIAKLESEQKRKRVS
jgi:sugar-specific transcriptional regulator TrmB